MRWPWKKQGPELEQRAAFPDLTVEYMAAQAKGLQSDGAVSLSATVATCAQTWSRAFAMLDPGPDPNPLRADVLGAIGMDLCLRGESCWHIRYEDGDLALHRAAYWDHVGRGRYHLHIAHPTETETVRALEGEVLRLTINSNPTQPWRGRSPFALMGGSPALMAELEGAISGAMDWVGRGILPIPDLVPVEQQNSALRMLKQGSKLVAIRSAADFTANTGGSSRGSEFKKIDLTPDLRSADLNPIADQLHNRLLAAAGIPPTLFTPSGNAGAMREGYRLFVLQTVEPIARMLMNEFAKVGVTSMDTSKMMSADVAGRARALGALVNAGVPLEEAKELCGWGKPA